jgi:GNAT superfamily N-acetyltransferase
LTAGVAAPVLIRPMAPDDVGPADAVAREVLSSPAPGESEAARQQRAHARIVHLLDTDPGGAWVAEHDGRVVGLALALIRERVWGLSLFAVAAAFQGRGVGRRLLEACRRYGERADGHLILSTEHPAAMRRYARLGLPLRPCVSAAGIVASTAMPALDGVEDAGEAGIPVADAIGRAVRGAGHGRDLPVPLAHGARLLVFEDRAFAVARAGEVMLLAARDEAAAARVLWAALTAGPPGGTVRVDFITAGQDWAVRACLDAGLALSPDGPLFAGGRLGPLRPYLPSGAYL